jgi:hypothetical protein
MPTLHMTDLKIRNLTPPQKPKQISYFDDPAKGGVRGLVLLHSYGDAKSWFCMYYENGKSKLFKLGRYPVIKLGDARIAALEFQRDPKAHLEGQTTPDTFEKVAGDFFKLYVAKKNLRTAKVMSERLSRSS